MEPAEHDNIESASSFDGLPEGEFIDAVLNVFTDTFEVHVPRLGLVSTGERIQVKMRCINKDTARNAAALFIDFIDGAVRRFKAASEQDVENAVFWACRLLEEQRERKTGAVANWVRNPDKFRDAFTLEQFARLQFLQHCDEAALREALRRFLNPPQALSDRSSDHDERKSNETSSDDGGRLRRPWERYHEESGGSKIARIAMNPCWSEAHHPFVFFHRELDSTTFRLNKLGWCLVHWELDAEHKIDEYCSETIHKVCNHRAMDSRDMNAFYSDEPRDWPKFFYNQQPWVLYELGQAVKHGLQQGGEFELTKEQLRNARRTTEDMSGLESGRQGGSPELWLMHLIIPEKQLPAYIVENIGTQNLFVELRWELGSELMRCAAVLSQRTIPDEVTRREKHQLNLKLTEPNWNKLQQWVASGDATNLVCQAILGLTPHLRYFTICIEPPIGNRIIPKAVACKGSHWMFGGQNLAASEQFNLEQLRTVVHLKLQNNPDGEIMFVEAPPGTGKSTTACELVRLARRQHKRVLCSTYSVEALCVLIEKLDVEELAAEGDRIVVAASMHNKHLNRRFERFCLDRRQSAWGAIENIKQLLQRCVQQLQQAISDHRIEEVVVHKFAEFWELVEAACTTASSVAFTRWERTLLEALNNVKRSVRHARLELSDRFVLMQKNPHLLPSNELAEAVQRLAEVQTELNNALEKCSWYATDSGVLSHAGVVFATLLVTGRRSGFPTMTAPHLLVVDEAAQATQLATMLALNTNPALAVFLGDTRQLLPFVSTAAEKAGYGTSTMYRFRNQLGDAVWNELAVMFRIQYRMHPSICDMVSTTFYENRLSSAHGLAGTRAIHNQIQHVIKPLCFIDICGHEQQQLPGTSRYNEEEADLCVKIAEYLLRSGIHTDEIGVVASYAAQVEQLKARFAQRSGSQPQLASVKVGSIDSFQGREKEYIILSCVRAQHRLGFLYVPNRINVAVTRARRAVIIVGHGATLRTQQDTKIFSVLEYCKLRDGDNCRYVTAGQFEREIEEQE